MFSKLLYCSKKYIISCTGLLLLNACTQSRPTGTEKIQLYESKARTFQSLADLQRLSPPFSQGNFAKNYQFHQKGQRTAYLKQARKYQKLALVEKKKLSEKTNAETKK
jgi:hypothetical protein